MNAAPTPLPPRPVTAVQIAAFLKRHLPQARLWPREKLLPWVTWFVRADRAVVVTDARDRIVGVALGRFIERTEGVAGRPLYDLPTAPGVWVDAIAARDPAAMPQIVAALTTKYAGREWVAGEAFSRNGERRMFPIKTLQRFFGG